MQQASDTCLALNLSQWGWDLAIGLAVFVLSFVVSLAFVVWVIVRLPVDYLRDSSQPHNRTNKWLPATLLIALTRNLLGLTLVAVGVVLSLPGVPGQGLLTIILGLMLMQFPGKRYLEKRLLGRPRVLAMLNRVRQRYGKEPLLPPEDAFTSAKMVLSPSKTCLSGAAILPSNEAGADATKLNSSGAGMPQEESALHLVNTLPLLPPRAADSHKGTFGRVLIVAGSRGMSGAAVLCGLGALRGGAGLVQVAVPQDILAIVGSAHPCYLTAGLPQDEHGRLSYQALEMIMELGSAATVVAFGPGLGQSISLQHLVARLVRELARPMVLDADGLNNLAQVGVKHLDDPPATRIITPHPGEFARLLGISTAQVQANREDLAVSFARKHGVILVLKGHGTIVTDGERLYRNSTGNPGMATGGSGDVLTGLLAALLAQRLEPFTAAQLAVFLHGRAGDLAREQKGEIGLVASDFADFLPVAIRQCTAQLIPQKEDQASRA